MTKIEFPHRTLTLDVGIWLKTLANSRMTKFEFPHMDFDFVLWLWTLDFDFERWPNTLANPWMTKINSRMTMTLNRESGYMAATCRNLRPLSVKQKNRPSRDSLWPPLWLWILPKKLTKSDTLWHPFEFERCQWSWPSLDWLWNSHRVHGSHRPSTEDWIVRPLIINQKNLTNSLITHSCPKNCGPSQKS
jgi:hypothetical protein